MTPSIRKQLLLWLLVPLLILWAINSVVAYNLSIGLSRQIFDSQLLNSADSVISRIKIKDEKVTADLPPAVLTVLRHNFKDKFFYQILNPDGSRIAGDLEIPFSQADVEDKSPVFKTMMVEGMELRIMTIRIPAHRNIEADTSHVIVQVAETRNARNEFVARNVAIVALAQLLLIMCGAVTVWYGIKRGLSPLIGLQAVISTRSKEDLRPVPEELAPVEVRSLVLEINNLLSRLRDDIDRQQRFIANAAHQLRTPLAGLKTYADLALKVAKEEETRGVLVHLHTGVARMSHLVNRLLSLARSEPAAASPEAYSTVDLNSIVSDTTEELVPLSIKRNIDLGFEGAERATVVRGDATALKELVTNLVENALIYTPKGGTVTVSVVNNGSPAVVVEDTGPGIPETERERVFERFYRLHAGETTGSGLGLAIVKEIAESHDADIKVSEGRAGIGTRVTVTF